MESPLSSSAERVNVVNDDQFNMPCYQSHASAFAGPTAGQAARIQSGDYVPALHIPSRFRPV